MKTIAVYHYSYLTLSETFIYRQLIGLSENFNLKVLTHRLENLEHYPRIQAVLLPERNIWDKLFGYDRGIVEGHLRGCKLFHVNFGHVAIGVQYYASRLGIPMTVYFLGVDSSAMLRSFTYRARLKRAKFASVFVNSEDMKRRLTPYLHPDTKCHVVYSGIPLEKFPFKQRHKVPDSATFLQVSRLDYKKGIDITLKAFSRYLKEYDPKATLIIAGDGPLKEELLKLMDSLKMKESVRFLGHVVNEQYINLLHTADVFLHPSVTANDGDMEGLPNAVAEAMACGLPVISTRHAGIPELVEHGKSGFLVEERDIAGLFNQMTALKMSDIESVSKKAREKIEDRFDQGKVVKILCEHMNDIIGGRIS